MSHERDGRPSTVPVLKSPAVRRRSFERYRGGNGSPVLDLRTVPYVWGNSRLDGEVRIE